MDGFQSDAFQDDAFQMATTPATSGGGPGRLFMRLPPRQPEPEPEPVDDDELFALI